MGHNMTNCLFCLQGEAIENSHIVPSFVYKWIKKTSLTGYLRTPSTPNKREQDGLKAPILCLECEAIFSKYEREFKGKVFDKIVDSAGVCPEGLIITDYVKRCISSIAWRTLAYTYYVSKDVEYYPEERRKFPEFLEGLKKDINTGSSSFQIHYVPCQCSIRQRLCFPEAHPFVYERQAGSEARIWDGVIRFVILINLPYVLLSLEIVSNEGDEWQGTRIDNVDIHYPESTQSVPKYIIAQIARQSQHHIQATKALSDRQRVQIEGAVRKKL